MIDRAEYILQHEKALSVLAKMKSGIESNLDKRAAELQVKHRANNDIPEADHWYIAWQSYRKGETSFEAVARQLPFWAQSRFNWIIDLGSYMREAHRVYQLLSMEEEEAFMRGYYEGQASMKINEKAHWRERHHTLDEAAGIFVKPEILKRFKGRELVRNGNLQLAKLKWPELF